MKKLIPFTLSLALLTSTALTSDAQVVVRTKPIRPAAVVVKPAAPGPNYVWVTGDWTWNKRQNKYVWRDGRWLRKKRGQRWVAGHWTNARGGHRWVPGHWARG